ncbi:MAG: tetratricopeptide repeat protein [Planctomycetales bacterium]|nr:tetratricopeptide repeat protein [Planctomycetales bacterium]
MAQSPDGTQSDASHMQSYNNGWRDLYRKMQSGESFSGRERNCCFLNVSDARSSNNVSFADVSAVSGFDFADDARATAVVDWDQDGDLDLWVANRTQPRVRFLQNTTNAPTQSLMIHLTGSRCNRDAIGTRVELHVGDRRLLENVRVGSGFLSQSSRWLHFGVSEKNADITAKVYWPSQDAPEIVQGLQPGKRYWIEQDKGVVKHVSHSPNLNLQLPESPPTPTLDPVRTVIFDRVPFPPLQYRSTGDKTMELSNDLQGPTLVNVWASSCQACVEELEMFSNKRSEFAAMGLRLVLLNGDIATDAAGDSQTQMIGILKRTNLSDANGVLNDQGLRVVDRVQKSFHDLHKDLAVPASFLLDKHGRVSVIYRGAVSFDQIQKDLSLLEADVSTVLNSLTANRGRWFHKNHPRHNLLGMATQLREVGYAPRKYFEHGIRVAKQTDANDPFRPSKTEIADAHFALGTELLQAKKPREAFEQLQMAVAIDQEHSQAHANIAVVYSQTGQWPRAEQHFTLALRRRPTEPDLLINRGITRLRLNKASEAAQDFSAALNSAPNDTRAIFNLGILLSRTGKHEQAIRYLKRGLQVSPDPMAQYHLATILATSPNRNLRDAKLALTLAESLNQATGNKNSEFLAVLSMAQAENKQFTRAIATIDKAIANVGGNSKLLTQLRKQRQAFEAAANANE